MAIDCAHRAFVLCLSLSQMCLPITGLCSLYIHLPALTNPKSKRNSQVVRNLKPPSIILLSSSGIYRSKCCCCSFLTNLFSLWLPFSQSLPSLQAFLSYAHPLLLTQSLSYCLLYSFLIPSPLYM